MAQFVVENGKRSDAALKATAAAAGAASAAAGRRVRLGPAAATRRRRGVRSTAAGRGAAVRRLVQLLLHHRHRDLAHLEEVADGDVLGGAAPAARRAVGRRRRRVVDAAVGRHAVLPPLEVGHRQRVDRPRRPRLGARPLAGHDRVAPAERDPVVVGDLRCGRFLRPTAAAAATEAAAMA